MNNSTLHWIATTLIPDLGPIKLSRAIEKHGSPSNVLLNYVSRSSSQNLLSQAEGVAERVAQMGGTMIPIDSPNYPQTLLQIPDAPSVLYVRGTLPSNINQAVAVVGTRRCTEDGAAKAGELAKCLAEQGRPLVSGMALGVDAAAHRASLALGAPTVAVLAHGLDRAHPKGNERLALRLLDSGGAWVTEHPPGTKVLPWMFAARNRILVGLCEATVMVQSPLQGGSMISAKFALGYNREVFAVMPEKGFSRVWEGNKELIVNSEAQKLIRVEDLPLFLSGVSAVGRARGKRAVKGPDIPERCRGVYDEIVRCQVVRPGSLALKFNERTRVIRTRLFVLELLRLVRRIPGDRYILT